MQTNNNTKIMIVAEAASFVCHKQNELSYLPGKVELYRISDYQKIFLKF